MSKYEQEIETVSNGLKMRETENQELTGKLQLLEEELTEKMSSVKIVEKKSSALV